MFVGRTRELDTLNKRYSSGKFEFAVIYGRRRVGKTTLINEFIKDKETVFYTDFLLRKPPQRLVTSVFEVFY
jgi:AAA+ ATPase superfamily predicted ATPase